MATLGILLISVVIGGIATTLLFLSQARLLEHQLTFATELQTAALDSELDRLRNIASQIASRTQIREQLERYYRGLIDHQTLVDFTVPKLADAMNSNTEVLGISRLSRDDRQLLEVGVSIDRAWWPENRSPDRVSVGIPVDGHLVVAAPIRNRTLQVVGTDLVMFRDDRLRAAMQGFFDHVETTGSVQIAALNAGRAIHFYDIGHDTAPLDHETLKSELIEQLRLGLDATLTPIETSDGRDLLTLHRHIRNSRWLFIFYADPAEFFKPARQQAAFAALTIMVLAILGILLIRRIIQPLVRSLSAETRSLQRLLRQNQELLDRVQANESRMQAIIDNAPAVIYIKDPSGRYQLVNQAFTRLLGRSREEIVGRFDYELFPDDIAKSTRDSDQEVFVSGNSVILDERAPHVDGMHDFLSTKFPLRDSRGEIYAICGIASDITERKQVERRLALTQATVDQASFGVCWVDSNGKVFYMNRALLDAVQRTPGDVGFLHIADLVPEISRSGWSDHWREISGTNGRHYESRFERRDGSSFPAEIYAKHVVHDGHAHYVALVHDITDRLASEASLRQSATVFDYTAEAIVITDAEARVLDTNAAFSQILGYSPSEVIGQLPSLWKSEHHSEAFYREMWQALEIHGEWRGEIVNRSKSGELVPAIATISAVRDAQNEIASYVAIYTDISHIKKTQQQLAHLAHHDPLTDLPNRTLFNERLQHSLDRSTRTHSQLAVIFVDIDNFKHINDSLGHKRGDELLVGVAHLLLDVLRKEDTVARIGGDEFMVLIEDFGERERLVPVIEKIMQAFEREFRLGDSHVRVTPSLGISISPDDGSTPDALMRNADAAMYRAKSLGRNTYQFYTEELTRAAFERMRMDTELSSALDNGEFRLVYQPQVDLETGDIIGIEALLRWNNADLGRVEPEQFLPFVEQNGIMPALGEWVLAASCRQARRWLDGDLLPGRIAINFSGSQMRHSNLARQVAQVLDDTGLPACRLELEINEHCVMAEPESSLRVLQELDQLGVTLVVDNFGTGYSSLAHLPRLPIARLKIDRSCVREIPRDSNGATVTRAVIAMARSMNIELLGAGIENEAQRQFLLDQGCRLGQGFLFHRPLEADDMEELLRTAAALPLRMEGQS